MLDDGAPTSTDATIHAPKLAETLGRNLELELSHARYHHGWELSCFDQKSVITSWTLVVKDASGKSTTIVFGLN